MWLLNNFIIFLNTFKKKNRWTISSDKLQESLDMLAQSKMSNDVNNMRKQSCVPPDLEIHLCPLGYSPPELSKLWLLSPTMLYPKSVSTYTFDSTSEHGAVI